MGNELTPSRLHGLTWEGDLWLATKLRRSAWGDLAVGACCWLDLKDVGLAAGHVVHNGLNASCDFVTFRLTSDLECCSLSAGADINFEAHEIKAVYVAVHRLGPAALPPTPIIESPRKRKGPRRG